MDKGNLSILLVYDDLSYNYYRLVQPSYVLPGNIYVFDLFVNTAGLVAVGAILETGVARYYNHWISSNIYRAYILDINGEVKIVIPVDYPKPQTFIYQGYRVINASIYYYSQHAFFQYKYLWYMYIKDAYYSPRSIKLYFNVSEVNYLATYDGIVLINGNNYYELTPKVFHWERQYYELWRYKRGTWILEYYAPHLPPYLEIHSLSYPIYNCVFIVLKDAVGNIYVAYPYRHSLVFGERIPSNWPNASATYVIRIGMIDYNVKVTIWRRSF